MSNASYKFVIRIDFEDKCLKKGLQQGFLCRIVDLYDALYHLKLSPIVALNRAVAVGNARGPEEGLAELSEIRDAAALKDYPFYPAAQGEFHRLAGRAQRRRGILMRP
jgi:predicted RNA polymerase sigma factor